MEDLVRHLQFKVELQNDLIKSRGSWSLNFMRILAFIMGFLILIAGLAWAAIEAGAPSLYVQIGAVILLGIGIIGAATTRTIRAGQDVTVIRDDAL